PAPPPPEPPPPLPAPHPPLPRPPHPSAPRRALRRPPRQGEPPASLGRAVAAVGGDRLQARAPRRGGRARDDDLAPHPLSEAAHRQGNGGHRRVRPPLRVLRPRRGNAGRGP